MAVVPKLRGGRASASNPGLRLIESERASWDAVEAYLRRDDRVIVPVGSQEQHGRHLPLGVDWMIPHALGRRLSAATGVPCMSPVCFGMSWLHSGFPGTVALRPQTLMALYSDVLTSLLGQGFRRIMILNGHGGNGGPLLAVMSELVREREEVRLRVFEWWLIQPVQEICRRAFGQTDSHAGPAETSVMLHLFPESVRMEAAADNASEWLPSFPSPSRIRALYPDGVMRNSPTRASEAIGREITAACLEFFSHALEPEGREGRW